MKNLVLFAMYSLVSSEVLAGIIFGLLARGWLPLLGASIMTAAFIGWKRIFFAAHRLKRGSSGPELIRDAQNLALCSGAPDVDQAALQILVTRELPPITFGVYFAAFWFSVLPMLLDASVIYSVRAYIFF